jgi:hypothetical protein
VLQKINIARAGLDTAPLFGGQADIKRASPGFLIYEYATETAAHWITVILAPCG